ncbi:unnamed protein product [Ilex paraguariensis]|uniref:Uncharacterized protein n=1 Tax=Ilex paraguariensis TaxID=185542 RepID=A0ABC8RIS8_9AQUA
MSVEASHISKELQDRLLILFLISQFFNLERNPKEFGQSFAHTLVGGMAWAGKAGLYWVVDKGFVNNEIMQVVNYQTLSPKDLAKSVMSEGGWSSVLCSGEKAQQSLDLALLFVGRELQSLDISGHKVANPALVDLLKVSFTRANFSLAFPYVAALEETETMEHSLISEFAETCGHDLGVGNIAFLESCLVEGENFEKLAGLHSVHDYLVTRMKRGPKGHANLIVFCHGGSHSLEELDQPHSESMLKNLGEFVVISILKFFDGHQLFLHSNFNASSLIEYAGRMFSELINSVEQSGAKYSVLYVSDPFRSIRYPSYRKLERFLAEGTLGNGSANSTTCDEVCQIKSSLLEGILVVSQYPFPF